jgi:hypothetical protein
MRDVPAGTSAIGVPADILGAEATRAVAALPADEVARRIEAVWCEALGAASIGHDANFFDVGGTSLLAVQVRARLCEVTGQEVSVVDLFRHTTIRSLAARLASAGRPADETERAPDRLRRLALMRQGARN